MIQAIVPLFLMAVALPTMANELPAPDGLLKTDWALHTYECPMGCSAIIKQVVQPKLNTPLHIGSSGVSGALEGECTGPTQVEIQPMPRKQLMAELNQALPPKARYSVKHMKRLPNPVNAGWVLCNGVRQVRVLSATPGELITLYEANTWLVYR